jgi:REP element-mobilizing transposase RayT
MDLPKRKRMRLKDYDYSQNGSYFITICTKNRLHFFGAVGRDAPGAPFSDAPGALFSDTPIVKLSNYGEAVRNEIEAIPSFYKGVVVEKYVIMPNHVHMILTVYREYTPGVSENSAPGASRPTTALRASRPTTALIPTIIGMMKKKTNKVSGYNLWQTSYYDHIIRDEYDYECKWRYIDENPAHWEFDENNMQARKNAED